MMRATNIIKLLSVEDLKVPVLTDRLGLEEDEAFMIVSVAG